MKARTKVIGLCCAVALCLSVTAMGSLAYLTSEDEALNTFTIGDVKITLDEADVHPDGTYVADHDQRVRGNSYHLVPGHSYIKDPTVTVLKDSEESYVRVLVTINKQDALSAIYGPNADLYDALLGGQGTNWECVGNVVEGDACAYELRYKGTVTPDGKDLVLEDVFQTFTLSGETTGEQLAELEGFTIEIVAQAIQADGFASADAAWEAFN